MSRSPLNINCMHKLDNMNRFFYDNHFAENSAAIAQLAVQCSVVFAADAEIVPLAGIEDDFIPFFGFDELLAQGGVVDYLLGVV